MRLFAACLLLSTVAAPAGAQTTAADFEGRWEAQSEDGTDIHLAELQADGGTVSGSLVRLEQGYFSGAVQVLEQLKLTGSVRDGALEFTGTLSTADGQVVPNALGRAIRRGPYLVVRLGTYEVGLAPPGLPLLQSGEGSPEAKALVSLVRGREYSSSLQAHGGGASVGARVHLSLCADGKIAYSRSELAATPGPLPETGVHGGTSWSRQGVWTIVLLAGGPVVRAEWEGTGSTYSLVDYIRIEPAPDGRSARVDGTDLPVTGTC